MALAGRASEAAEIRVFSANGVKTIMGDLVPRFENTTGHSLVVVFGEAGEVRHRILQGDGVNLAVLPTATLGELAKQRKITVDSIVDVARTDVGMAVRSGAAKPDTSSADAFKRSLLETSTIVITDPASGGVSGVHFASVLQRLGIADEMRLKLRLTRGVFNAQLVADGDAELAVQLAHEIHAVAGVDFVALPAGFQRSIVFSAGIAAGARERATAREFIEFLVGPIATPMITARGMAPAAVK
jgi:molybdate transport system substrate-binding protein